jgi:biotin carboxylase
VDVALEHAFVFKSKRRAKTGAKGGNEDIGIDDRLDQKESDSILAVRVGFEPTEPVKVQRFSRPPDSTALAPHRIGTLPIYRISSKVAKIGLSMPRILLVAATTGYQTRSFAAAAQRLGIDIVLATDRCHVLEDPWLDRAIPVRFDEPESAIQSIRDVTIDGVVAVADRPTLLAAFAARDLGVPYHVPEAVARCRNKHVMRGIFEAAGLPVPENFQVPLDSDPASVAARAPFPCVLKPLGLSASRGVIRADGRNEFIAAFERIRRILERRDIRVHHDSCNDAIQVERYIEGREFAVEALVTNGELQVLAIFDKPDPLEGPYFEETIYTTPSREPARVQSAIVETTRAAVAALGLTDGPVHAEMRVNNAGVFMLEVAARPIGGLCARALRFEGGLTLEDAVLLHAIRKMPAELTLCPPASGVMMIPVPRAGIFESVSGVDRARETPGVDDVVITAIPGQQLATLPEGASYTGFIFASGNDPAAVEEALRRSHARLTFQVLSTLPVF